MTKRRLDTLLVDRGLADSPRKAQALVMAGQVLAGARLLTKPGMLVDAAAELNVVAGRRYVSRGGEKLEHALRLFGLPVSGLVVVDIGASTGGFTDCLLQHGASRVYSVDAGKGQLDYRLRNDSRVTVMEGVNARLLRSLPEPVDLAAVDVSFISLRLVLPVIARLLVAGGSIIALFKPQFEAAKGEVPRGGVIRDPLLHSTLIGRFAVWSVTNGFRLVDVASSPILGSSGNREFLFWLRPVVSESERSR